MSQPDAASPEAAAVPEQPHHGHGAQRALTPALILGVLGVVYGDIGTSPLYALKASVLHFAADGVERWEILGLLSLIFWSLMLTVTVKYNLFILRADNRGDHHRQPIHDLRRLFDRAPMRPARLCAAP